MLRSVRARWAFASLLDGREAVCCGCCRLSQSGRRTLAVSWFESGDFALVRNL
jgi:hypothetical protein